jgi:hypothetical protein
MLVKSLLSAAAVSCALIGSAVAMPADHLSVPAAASVQKAAWVCGPYRCWWRPGPWGYGRWAWGWGRPWGWHHWHHWHRWG